MNSVRRITTITTLILIITCKLIAAAEPSKDDLESWFKDDSRLHPHDTRVNEGQLEFLSQLPDKPVPYSRNELQILPSSLDDGWVNLQQCHDKLDAVPEAEIVYQYKQIRELRITRSELIGKSRVVGQSVQLEDIERGAKLCVAAQVRIFYSNPDGSFTLLNGPFQRRFLDGYYPMRVNIRLSYPDDSLQFTNTLPLPQPGFDVKPYQNELLINALFEGKLFIQVNFRRK